MTGISLSSRRPGRNKGTRLRIDSALVSRAAILVVISILATVGCRTVAVPGASARIDRHPGTLSVPMCLVRGIPLVQVEVCGRGPYWFVVDTGCGFPVVLSKSLADEMRLPEVDTKATMEDATGARTAVRTLVVVESMRVGNAQFGQCRALTLDLTDFKDALGVDFEGILGFPLFAGSLLTLDFPRRELVLRKGELPQANDADVLAYKILKGSPIIDVALGTVSVPLIIDSGCMGNFSLPETVEGNLHFRSKPVAGGLTPGVRGNTRIRVGRLSVQARIGRYVVEDPLVSFLPAPVTAGRVGTGVLKYFSVTFDQSHGTVRFRRKETSPIATPPLRTTGLGMRKRSDKWQVEDIIPNTPAGQLDIKKGDEVVAVNRRPTREIDVDTWFELVEKEDTLTLDIERDGTRRQFTVPVTVLVP